MLKILLELIPIESRKTEFLTNLALNCLSSKIYKLDIPEISLYQIEIHFYNNVFTIINHQNYTTEVSNISLLRLRTLVSDSFKITDFNKLQLNLNL